MVDIKWCFKQKDGIKLIEPNDNLAKGYIKMAEDALGTMNREKDFSLRFSVSACYYSMYYSLYAILMKIGIKCEIHSCTLKFMKEFLSELYSKEDIKTINKAFDCRNIIQYYIDRVVQKSDSNFIISEAPFFYTKSKEILGKLNESQVKKIREKINIIK
ncbi:MAG: HEPN domain-containing protein [Nanoarchaeota archaeon]